MEILIDTREQQPLRFFKKWEYMEGTSRYCLSREGDYAVRFKDGHIPPVRIERKSLGDLFGTLGKGMPRFMEEIENCIDKGLQLYIFIECPLSDILDGHRFSKKVKPQSVVRTLNTLEVKYGVIYKCFSSRSEMARAIYELFYALGKQYDKKKRAENKERNSL